MGMKVIYEQKYFIQKQKKSGTKKKEKITNRIESKSLEKRNNHRYTINAIG